MKRAFVVAAAMMLAWSASVMAQSGPGMKIGIFDPGRVSEETEAGKKIAERLSALNDQKVAEIQKKEKQVNDMQAQLTSQGLSLSADKRTQLEKDIQKAALDLNQAREAARNELQLEVSEAQNNFQMQLLQVVEQFGREEAFDLILVDEPALIPFHANALDVTTAIVDRFNKVFPAPADAPAKPAPTESKKN